MSTLFVLGISLIETQFNGKQAQLNISRPLREINTENYKRQTIGNLARLNPKWDQPIMIDRAYAEKLAAVGAFVPRREYGVKLEMNPNDPLAGAIVTELIPADEEIRKHFETRLKRSNALTHLVK